MNKEKLIAEMREAFKEKYNLVDFKTTNVDLAGISECFAEAAIKHMPQWVRVEEVPLTESGWVEFITKNGMNNGYYDDEFPNTVWSEKGSTRAKARVSSIIVYRKTEQPKE